MLMLHIMLYFLKFDATVPHQIYSATLLNLLCKVLRLIYCAKYFEKKLAVYNI